jgi:phosphonate transport system ATP-binding protein
VGLLAQADQRADTLSGSQQQRVAIARAMAQRTELIIADEPMVSLDPHIGAGILELLNSGWLGRHLQPASAAFR